MTKAKTITANHAAGLVYLGLFLAAITLAVLG